MALKRQIRQWGAALVAAACLLVVVLPMGGIPPLPLRIASVLLACVGALASAGLPRLRVGIPFAALSAWCMLQVVPLPMGVLAVLSPKAADVWHEALSPLGGAVAFAPLSLCPEATWLEACKWSGLAGAAWIGAATQRRAGLSRSISVGLVAALTVAAVHVAHGALGLKRVYGLYTPNNTFSGLHVGPLLNVNNLSGYLLLGIFSGLALVYSSRLRQSVATALVLLSTSALVIGVITLASRSAVAALLLGSVVATGAYLARWKRGARQISATGAIVATAAVIGVGTALAFLGFEGEISSGLGERNYTKLRVVVDALPMIADFPLFGVGRGAFSGIYHQYRTVPDDEFWTHPENIGVAFSVEWGLPATILALALFAWVALSSKPRRSAARLVLLVGVATVVVQNLFDFGLEALGVGALAAYLFGVAASGGDGEPRAGARGALPLRVTVAALALVAAAMSFGATTALDARRAAFEVAKAQPPRALQQYLSRFPGDPYFALLGGMAAGRDDPPQSLRWFNRALELAPHWGLVHLELARVLVRIDARSQALLELRLVVDGRSTSSSEACSVAVSIARTDEELLSVAQPGSPNELEALRVLWRLLPPQSSRRRAVEERLLAGAPCETPVLLASAAALVDDLRQDTPRCGGQHRDDCVKALSALNDRIRECPNGSAESVRLGAEIAWAKGDYKSSLDTLESACSTTTASVACFEDLAVRAASIKDFARLQRATRVVTSARCASPASCAAAWAWASQAHRAAGDGMGTYLALQKAVDADPTPAGYRAVAEAASAAGMRDRAIAALKRALALEPGDEASRAQLSEFERSRPASSAFDLPRGPVPRPGSPGPRSP